MNWLVEAWRSVTGAKPDPETILPENPAHVRSLRRADRLIEDARQAALREEFRAADRKVHR